MFNFKQLESLFKLNHYNLFFLFIMCFAGLIINYLVKHLCCLLKRDLECQYCWNRLRTPQFLLDAKKVLCLLQPNFDFLQQISLMFIGMYYDILRFQMIVSYQLVFLVLNSFYIHLMDATYPFTAMPFAFVKLLLSIMILNKAIDIPMAFNILILIHASIQFTQSLFDLLWLYVRLILNFEIVAECWLRKRK